MRGLVGFWRQVLYLKPSSYMSQQTFQKEGSFRLFNVILDSPNGPPTLPQPPLRMTPLTHPAKKIDQVDSKIKDIGVVLHVQEEVYQSTLTFRRRVTGYQDPSSQNF